MRKYLVLTVWFMFVVILAAAACVLFGSLGVSDYSADDNIRIVDISNLKSGEILEVKMKYQVWILHRSERMIEGLREMSGLADPESARSIQPLNARNNFRSIDPRYFVFVPLFDWTNKYSGWHGYLGVKVADLVFDNGKAGWFIDSVGVGLRFDLSGRVASYEGYDWLEEVNNVVVPSYKYLDSGEVKIDLSNLHLSSDSFE